MALQETPKTEITLALAEYFSEYELSQAETKVDQFIKTCRTLDDLVDRIDAHLFEQELAR